MDLLVEKGLRTFDLQDSKVWKEAQEKRSDRESAPHLGAFSRKKRKHRE